ncbi:MAG: Gfo/Idh/MocA family oxidoreductase [Pseudomonadota bacterium]
MANPRNAPPHRLLRWALIGGGEDSQIGLIHRMAAPLDRRFCLVAGALDKDPARGREFAQRLGIAPARAYDDWRALIAGERARDDRPDLVTVATPNQTHYAITKALLEAGFHVLCEKPLTMTAEQAHEIIKIAQDRERVCAVNYGYTGYPLVRQMRAMVTGGQLGDIRIIVPTFAGGFFAQDQDNPRIRWRFDPSQAGNSAVTMDAGIHALHLACFITDQDITRVSADFFTGVGGRQLEDDAWIAFRMRTGCAGRLWTSGLAVGRTHGLGIEVYGSLGGLRWQQEQPNQLLWTPLGEPSRILERGAGALSPAAQRASRVTVGHSEGMTLAFANIYRDLAEVIAARHNNAAPDPLACDYPTAKQGGHSLAVIEAAIASAAREGAWVDVVDEAKDG